MIPSELWARLAACERGAAALVGDLAGLKWQARGVGQAIRESWQELGAEGSTVATCNPGNVSWLYEGCGSLALAGASASVTVNGTVFTGTTDAFGSLGIPVNSAIVGTSSSFTYTTTFPGGRFAADTGSGTVTCGATTSFFPVMSTPAAGFACVASKCGYPIARTLHLTIGSYTATLTWSSGTTWAGSFTASGASVAATCPSFCSTIGAGTYPVTVTYFANTSVLRLAYPTCLQSSPRATFPATSGCNTNTFDSTSNAVACPPSFLGTGTTTDPLAWLFSGAQSFSIAE